MKFPTSNSSTAVGSNSAQLPVDSSSTGNAISPPTTASASSTAVPHSSETHNSNKKSENEPAQNMAANFTSTAGNFFRRYTSTSGHSANAQEMTTLNIKVVSLDQNFTNFQFDFSILWLMIWDYNAVLLILCQSVENRGSAKILILNFFTAKWNRKGGFYKRRFTQRSTKTHTCSNSDQE